MFSDSTHISRLLTQIIHSNEGEDKYLVYNSTPEGNEPTYKYYTRAELIQDISNGNTFGISCYDKNADQLISDDIDYLLIVYILLTLFFE